MNRLIVEWIKMMRKTLGEKLILFNTANPVDHMQSLDLEAYRKLNIDYLLVQNYDKGDRYMDMVKASLAFKNLLSTSYGYLLMLPFFSVSSVKGGVSSSEVADTLLKKGVGLADIHNGICRFVPNGSRETFFVPCYNYFRKVLGMCKGQGVGVGFWEGGNGLENYYRFL